MIPTDCTTPLSTTLSTPAGRHGRTTGWSRTTADPGRHAGGTDED